MQRKEKKKVPKQFNEKKEVFSINDVGKRRYPLARFKVFYIYGLI